MHLRPKTAFRNGRDGVQFFEKAGKPAKWKHPDAPGTSGVYPVKKDKVIYHVAGNQAGEALSDPTRAGLVAGHGTPDGSRGWG